MKTVKDILQDADPLRLEPNRLEEERGRLRRAVLAAAAEVGAPSSRRVRAPVALLVTVALIVVGVAGSKIWSGGSAALQAAAVRFEVRLAEGQPATGLREVRIGADRVVYLHEEDVVTNDDISQSRVIQGDAPSRFGVEVTFNAAGAEKMRQATASHVGGPVAILIDGEVVSVPTLRGPISTSAVISGDFTRAEADRIANGMSIR